MKINREAAKKAGYTDAEISEFEAKQGALAAPTQPPIKIDSEAAKAAGYNDQEIKQFVTKAKPTKDNRIKIENDFPITQTFGQPSQYDVFSGGINYGVDYGTPVGTDVNLPEGNYRVVSTYKNADPTGGYIGNSENEGYGNMALIKNEDTGEYLRLSHLADVPLEDGQSFKGGYVGKTGASGNVTGAHLDVEAYDPQGNLVDVLKTPYKDLVKDVKYTDTPTPEPVSAPLLGSTVQQQEAPTLDPKIERLISQAPASKHEQLKAVADSLKNEGILTPNSMAYAMATIGHETAGTFDPIEEYGGREQARKLGYEGGEDYYGRGYIQLTHRNNYDAMGKRIGVPDLADNPQKALDPAVSAKVVGAFFKDRGVADLANKGDFVGARGPVNGTDRAQEIADQTNKYLMSIQDNPNVDELTGVKAIPPPVVPPPQQPQGIIDKLGFNVNKLLGGRKR